MDLKGLMHMGDSEESKDPKDMEKMKAKMEVIEELRNMASSMMGEGMEEGMNQVTVAADDEAGLKAGLEMAEDVVEEGPEAMMGKKSESYEPSSNDSYDDSEEYSSVEEIDAKIAELMQMKEQMEG